MHAILIDPKAKTIAYIEYNGDYKDIYRLIDATTFTTVRVNERNTLYVDDEGLFKPNQYYFAWGPQEHLGGKGLVVGLTEEGDDAPVSIDLKAVQRDVSFYDKQPIFSHIDEREEPHAEILPGLKGYKITRTAKFK